MTRAFRRGIELYAIAVVAVAVGIGLKLLLGHLVPQAATPFLLMALVVIVGGWWGGFGPGMLATALSVLAVRWLFMEPVHSLKVLSPDQATALMVFIVEGAFVSVLCEARLRAVEGHARAREELEERVRERTGELTQLNASLQSEIIERRRVEEEVAHQREFLQALLASMEEGIVAVDAEGRVNLVNRAALEMYGLPTATVPYERWEEYHRVYYGDGVTPMPHAERPLYLAARGQEVVDIEKVVITNDGKRRDLLSNGRVIRDERGNRLGAVVAFHDITERKRSQEELQRYADQLQRSNRELQDFASVASHDLQEPLRKIQAFGDRLRVKYEGTLGPEGQDYLARMLNAAGRMSTLISDLLTFSRVTTKAQPFRPVKLEEVARDVVLDLEARIEQTGGRVEVSELPTVDADPMQIRQLLQNLIGNALKFHRPETAPVVRISGEVVRAAADEEPRGVNGTAKANGEAVCRLQISDNGIGFDEKYLDRIFNVFQRLHGRSAYEGTGIGLAVCRKIAERHHGSITARSKPGEGSTFIVTLPVRQVAGEAGSHAATAS